MLPEGVQRRTGITVDPFELDVSVNPTDSAGAIIAGWWRLQNPLPVTEKNERLREHPRRIAYAHEHFEARGDRLDERGRVFIQLGKPSKKTWARLGPGEEAAPHQANVRIRDNDFWTHPDVDPKAHFLFVNYGTLRFELSGVDMLFPPDVHMGLGRSFDATLSHPAGLQRVLGQLAAYHEDFGLRSSEVVGARQAGLNQAKFGIRSEENPNVNQAPARRPAN